MGNVYSYIPTWDSLQALGACSLASIGQPHYNAIFGVLRHGPCYKKLCSCTPDRNCHTFCLGDKIASHPGVLTQAKKNTQNLEINQILGVVVQEKESNMVFCSRWKFPTLGMTVLSGTSAEPRFRSAWSSLGLETSI